QPSTVGPFVVTAKANGFVRSVVIASSFKNVTLASVGPDAGGLPCGVGRYPVGSSPPAGFDADPRVVGHRLPIGRQTDRQLDAPPEDWSDGAPPRLVASRLGNVFGLRRLSGVPGPGAAGGEQRDRPRRSSPGARGRPGTGVGAPA